MKFNGRSARTHAGFGIWSYLGQRAEVSVYELVSTQDRILLLDKNGFPFDFADFCTFFYVAFAPWCACHCPNRVPLRAPELETRDEPYPARTQAGIGDCSQVSHTWSPGFKCLRSLISFLDQALALGTHKFPSASETFKTGQQPANLSPDNGRLENL
jgi:hypothetical protein